MTATYLKVDMLCTTAGMEEHEAAFLAVDDAVLQTVELHSVTMHKIPEHVYLNFYNKVVADKSRQANNMTIGVLGGSQLKLTAWSDNAAKETFVHVMRQLHGQIAKETFVHATVSSHG